MINKLIVFLIRRKLHLKKYERFKFANQKKKGVYYFDSDMLIKVIGSDAVTEKVSSVSLNYLVSNEVEIIKIK